MFDVAYKMVVVSRSHCGSHYNTSDLLVILLLKTATLLSVTTCLTTLLHYLVDFIRVGTPDCPQCALNLSTALRACECLGLALHPCKCLGPSPMMTVLSIL